MTIVEFFTEWFTLPAWLWVVGLVTAWMGLMRGAARN